MSFGLPDGKTLSYGGYLRVPELLALQECRSQPAQHDETLFIVIHQVYELWFKQLLHEVDAVIGRLDRDDVLHADRMLRRCIEIQRVLVAQLKVLETMTPMDFLAFRDHIMPASGFQSAQFRELEFVSGLKDPRFLSFFRGEAAHDRLQARLEGRTLPDAYHDLLRRRGFDIPAEEPGDDDETRASKHRRRLEELMRVYRGAEEHYSVFLLTEALIEYDEMFLLWRFRHVQMVERVIGARPGTGGSEGSAYLRTTVERRFFPELWELRSYLGMAGGGAGSAPHPIAGGYGASPSPSPSAEGEAPPPSGGCPMGH